MSRESIPEDVRRFILACITSVPYLEAIILLRDEPGQSWDGAALASRLYLSEKIAEELLRDLFDAGIIAEQSNGRYSYRPSSDELKAMLDRLARTYAKHIVEITTLVHSVTGKQAQQFADAFKWRKD